MAMYKTDGKHVDLTVAAQTKAGTLVQIGSRIGIVDPHPEGRDWQAGEDGVATVRGTVEIDNSGVAFAYGATVGYDQTNDQAVVAAGGDFDVGPCVNQGGAGTTDKVRVLIG